MKENEKTNDNHVGRGKGSSDEASEKLPAENTASA